MEEIKLTPEFQKLEELKKKVISEIKSLPKLSEDEILRKIEEIKKQEVLNGAELADCFVGIEEESGFKMIPVSKIVGKPFGHFGDEFQSRQGRIKSEAFELLTNPETLEQFFHFNKPNERIKVTEIEGPSGPFYFVDDGNHRVAACMATGIKDIPCEVRKIKYPLVAVASGNQFYDQKEDWKVKIEKGLINGKLIQEDSGKFLITKEIVPWIRTTSQRNFLKIGKIYETLYPNSLENLGIPRDFFVDIVGNNRFLIESNLGKERLEQFRVLRKKIHEKIDKELKLRKKSNPNPTEMELRIGAFMEMLEPQVREAIKICYEKGYTTHSSGFGGEYGEIQSIDGYFAIDDDTQKKIEALEGQVLKGKDTGMPFLEDEYTFIQFKPNNPNIKEIEEKWLQIVDVFPSVKGGLKPLSTSGGGYEFRTKYAPERIDIEKEALEKELARGEGDYSPEITKKMKNRLNEIEHLLGEN